jgi:hypothetical protein
MICRRHCAGAQNRDSLRLARLATLWFVFELLIVEEQLLPGREDKVGAAINTLQNFVLKFHGNAPFALGRLAPAPLSFAP